MSASEIVAEPVRDRLHYCERMQVSLLLRSIRASRKESNLHLVTCPFRSFLDGGAAAQHNQVGERDLLPFVPVGLRAVELLLDRLQLLKNLRQCGWLVHFPILLRRETNTRAIRPTPLVGAAERRRRRPGSRDQIGD